MRLKNAEIVLDECVDAKVMKEKDRRGEIRAGEGVYTIGP